jgi:Ran GTPase-activating protein (RanGAP) involved in mRNA processing and transport
MAELSAENLEVIAKGLTVNRTLQALDLSSNTIRTKGAATLLSHIIDGNLRELRLSMVHMADDFGPHLAHFLEQNRSLRVLDLSGNSLTQKFVASIAGPLTRNLFLLELTLARNPLGSRGMSVLGSVVADNGVLRKLDISACKIHQAGFVEFCTTAKANRSLEIFDCHHNPMRDEGAIRLAEVFREWIAIREVDFELCEIGDSGAQALFGTFEASPTLRKVSIKTNVIRDGAPITHCLHANPKIVVLDIDYNDMGFRTYGEIKRLTMANYRRWKGQQKQLTPEEAEELAFIDRRLFETREAIVDRRKEVAVLVERRDKALEDFTLAQEAKTVNVSILEQRVEEISQLSNQFTDEIRVKNEEVRSTSGDREAALSGLTNRLARETEQNGVIIRKLAQIECQIESTRKANAEERAALLSELRRARRRYEDIKSMFLGSWDDRQMQIAAEKKAAEDAPRSDIRSERQGKRGKRSRAGKRKGTDAEEKPPPEEGPAEPENQAEAPAEADRLPPAPTRLAQTTPVPLTGLQIESSATFSARAEGPTGREE